MSKKAYEKMQQLRMQLEADPEYAELELHRREAEPGFLAVLAALPQYQREIIVEFFGIMQEQGLREIEIACFDKGK